MDTTPGATHATDLVPSAQQPADSRNRQPLALVVGGSRGLGLLCAEELLQHGHRVVISSRSADSLQAAREHLLAEHPGATVDWVTCDIRDRRDCERLVQQVEDRLGPVDVLLTVAGVIQVGPGAAMTHEHFDEALGTMLHGTINVTLPVLERMRARRRGRIGVVSSMGGKVAAPHMWPYSTAKFGLTGFSEGLRGELAGTGITCTTVLPGLMRTGGHESAQFTGDHAAEYAWFATAASLPLLSIDAARAAEKIVHGVLQGHTHVVFTPLAQLGIRVHGLVPELTTRVMALSGALLPSGGPSETLPGREVERRHPNRVVHALTTLGRAAAARDAGRRR